MTAGHLQVTVREAHACFGGRIVYASHRARETATQMRFAVYEPPQARQEKVPVLYYLAGLTCTEETFMIKAGALRCAAEHGLMLVSCDTSPRGLDLPGESDSWDFGVGAGFYLDAKREPWAAHYRMGSYVNRELPEVIEANFPALPDQRGIFGHSMGGHGALVTALRDPGRWRSVSAFAPICHPSIAPWGEKAFTHYLGQSLLDWAEWDACLLMRKQPYPGPILVDQGLADPFLERELRPQTLRAAAQDAGQALSLREHEGYDHSYWFIQSFVADHLRHHAALLFKS